jgi:hypothetical protein
MIEFAAQIKRFDLHWAHSPQLISDVKHSYRHRKLIGRGLRVLQTTSRVA